MFLKGYWVTVHSFRIRGDCQSNRWPECLNDRFDKDIKWRTQVEIIPVPCYAHDNFSVTRGNLETAYHSALQRGMTVRAVLLSTPSYPVGNVLDRATLQSILSFTHENSIHLISDEVYAGCVFEDSDFVSVAEISESSECDRSRVHIIYGLSKDLGVVGFQVGVLYSWNMQVIAAANKLTRFCGTSSHTQGLLAPLLADESFIKMFLTKNLCRITQRHQKVVTALDAVGIKFAKSSGGLFCWIFLGHCLRSSSQEEEMRLCRYVSEEIGVHLTPGSSSCSCPEPGWFSLCFAGVDDQTLNIALQRLQKLAPGVQYWKTQWPRRGDDLFIDHITKMSQSSCKMFSFSCMMYRCCLCSKIHSFVSIDLDFITNLNANAQWVWWSDLLSNRILWELLPTYMEHMFCINWGVEGGLATPCVWSFVALYHFV